MKPTRLNSSVHHSPVTALLGCILLIVPAAGQSGGDYDLSWYTIDGGSGVSAGGDFQLFATIGQPDANTVVMTGGEFQLTGGLWPAVACVGDIDGDGDTDQQDLGAFLSAWCTQEGDPNWNPWADLDGDGHVGHTDLGILLSDWGCGT